VEPSISCVTTGNPGIAFTPAAIFGGQKAGGRLEHDAPL